MLLLMSFKRSVSTAVQLPWQELCLTDTLKKLPDNSFRQISYRCSTARIDGIVILFHRKLTFTCGKSFGVKDLVVLERRADIKRIKGMCYANTTLALTATPESVFFSFHLKSKTAKATKYELMLTLGAKCSSTSPSFL